jgi:protein-disulfide isomerase
MFHVIVRLPQRDASSATGQAPALIDLADPVDPEIDHIRGPVDAPVTLVEYGDFECPYCGQAEPAVRSLLSEFGADLRFVFRHLPLEDVHENAQRAAEVSEIAAAHGKFWEMHDLLFGHQDTLTAQDLVEHAGTLGLDRELVAEQLRKRKYRRRVTRDIDSADQSGVAGTPTFFVNGSRHHGAYDIGTLAGLVRAALAQQPTPS